MTTATMRAIEVARFGGPEVLTRAEVARPEPTSTEVLVEVHAAGVNPVDYKTRAGEGVARWVGALPFIPGWDIAGVVVSAGYGVTRFKPGDRVFGLPRFPRAAGAYAEYATARSLELSLIPERLTYLEAATLPLASLTAWQSLVDAAKLEPGQIVLVHGASGGVGHLAAQLALAQGARVIATASAESHGFLRALGVQQRVDRKTVPVDEAATGVDIVVDLVGAAETRASLKTLRPGGTLLAIAHGADQDAYAEAERLGVRVLEPLVEPDGRTLDRIAALVADSVIRPVVNDVLPLEQAADAHRRLEGGGVRGKLVLAVRDQNSGRSAE